MCGIAGIIGPNVPRDVVRNIFPELVRRTQKRGDHATGVAATMADGSPIISAKAPVPAKEFTRSKEFTRIVDEFTGGAIIGHCRKTTKGDQKNNDNNHPLISPHSGIALIHNGTVQDTPWRITNDDGENPYMYGKFNAEVDTESILNLIDTMQRIPRNDDLSVDPLVVEATPKDQWKVRVDLNRAIQDAVFNLTGPMSCAVISPDEPNSVRLWRNKDKPCMVAYVPDLEMIVFSSEEDFLDEALVDYEFEWILDYFGSQQDVFPEWYCRSTEPDRLTHIAYTGGDKPFSIVEHKIKPGQANVFRSDIKAGTKHVVQKSEKK